MDKETTIQLLNKFVDYEKSNLRMPFIQETKIGKYLCATNAKIVVLIPATADNEFENEEGFIPPSIDRILPIFDELIDINFKYFLKLYNDISIIERFATNECGSCEGAGSFTHYGNSYDCKECDETGEVETSYKEKCKNPNTAFLFKDGNNEVHIELKYIIRIIDVYNTLQKENVSFSIVKLSNLVVWFKLDDIYIGTVKIWNFDEEVKKWDVINVKLN